MRLKDWFVIIICVVLGGIFLTLADGRMKTIRTARQEMGLVANAPLENAPPSLAFATIAMGAFRGIVVDILWMRADSLKDQGKFFDAKQLAEWITTLQPRFAQVWDFHAWNMAYNISVAIPNTQPEERWHWVKNGYELLRDRAIVLNPHSILLYRSLAWIFQHKIAGISDDCHRYYKRELALSIQQLLGENPTSEYFDKLAASPQTLTEMLIDPETAKFVTALQTADPAFLDKDKLIANYLLLRQTPGRFSEAAFEVIETYRETKTLQAFDVFARAYQLRHIWKFDIDFMIQLNKEYGPTNFDDPNDHMPLNWRHPAAHSLYWGSMGLEVASRQGQYRIDEKNTDRIVFHSLQLLYRTGNEVLYEIPGKESAIYLLPDLRMFYSCDRAWRDVIKKYEAFKHGNPKAVKGGHKNFLENAVLLFYQAGHRKKAAQLYKRLQRDHLIDPSGHTRKEYTVPFLTFIHERLKSELDGVGPQDATEFIVGVLQEGYYLYAIHEDDEASGRENMAQEIYDIYQKEMGLGEPDRMGLPPISFMRYRALVQFLKDPMYPDYMHNSLLARIQVERPDMFEELKKQAEILEQLKKEQQKQESTTP